ncbi:MAG TPA: 1-acyl-sn-glycerol-3-phosphate acyltransferase [Sandaracinaceae bacterium LLY-WYZ-13_1]|nr:1-acyl-sn-glycerol-3-phosphate acyltransferase [Sandaracinaceae bacterium LLY-WYZ-13_1]
MTDARTESETPPRHAPRRPDGGSRASCGPEAVEAPAPSTDGRAENPSFEPNRALRWLYTRFFRHMHIDERWSGVVRESASQGIVVYVMRSISVLDFLCLDYLVKRFRLPLVRFVNDLGLWILEPFGRGDRRLRLRRQIPQEEALAKVLQAHESALLFLRRPPQLGEGRTGQGLDVDLMRTLVAQQRKLERPILVVPQTFVWTQRPPNKKPTLLDLVFGPSEWPGRTRVFLRFLLNYRNAKLRSGEPFDVRTFLEEHQDLTDAEAADRMRYALLRRIERERQVVLGPAKKTAGRIREELIRSPRVRKHIAAAARDQDASIAEIERQADKELRKLCAMMDPNAIGLFARILSWVFTRIYDGIVLDPEGMERTREAARHGPLILLPSHKSHVDYLVLSYVLANNAVSPPLIAAGDNLSFFPIGPFLRRSGAFFIRRSFRGRKLYAALVSAYLRKILVEGFNVEFFMEGGRSRTGKLLPPKLGLLSMVVDAGLQLPSTTLSFVPVSVGYERVIEERAYTHEQTGGEKEPESMGGLLRSSKVLRSRYGRLYIQFGQIFSLEELLEEAARLRGDADRDPRALRPPERRALINRIAHRVTHEIDRATIVTPAALVASALLSHRRRGMTHAQLLDRCAALLAALQRAGARIARPVVRDDAQVVPPPDAEARSGVAQALLHEAAVDETLALFGDAKTVETRAVEGAATHERVHSVPPNRRLALEYHKNSILSFFVPSALISNVLCATSDALDEDALRAQVAELSRLFKYEFMYRADATFDEIFDDALRTMVEAGELERVDGSLRAVEGSLVPVYAEMLRTYVEAYRLAVLGLEELSGEVKKKDWVKQTLARGKRMYLSGELERAESLSKHKLENALSALHDDGFVRKTREALEPGAALKDDEAIGRLSRRLARYLP